MVQQTAGCRPVAFVREFKKEHELVHFGRDQQARAGGVSHAAATAADLAVVSKTVTAVAIQRQCIGLSNLAG